MKTTKKRIVTKLVSFILSVLLFFYAIPSVIYAETIDALLESGTQNISDVNGEQSQTLDFLEMRYRCFAGDAVSPLR